MNEPQPGIYQHYKKKYYRVYAVGFEEATLNRVVIYQALYKIEDLGDYPWMTRPLENFMEEVETPEGMVPRFTYVGDDVPA